MKTAVLAVLLSIHGLNAVQVPPSKEVLSPVPMEHQTVAGDLPENKAGEAKSDWSALTGLLPGMENVDMDKVDDFWTFGIDSRVDDIVDGKVERRHVTRRVNRVVAWVAFITFIALGIGLEMLTMKSWNKDLSIKDAVKILACWLVVTSLFLVYIYNTYDGKNNGIVTWLDGYVLEMMLSVDNLFVFVLIMKSFSVPQVAKSKVLLIGVVAALVLRVAMFGCIWLVLQWATVITKVLGVFIIYCAWKIAMLEEEDEEIQDNPCVKLMAWMFPVTQEIDAQGSFFIEGKATPVFFASGALIFLDVIFAVDSVSAKTALISDVYLNYTSTGFAMFALRAMYYLLESAADMFDYLKYGISIILALIGAKTLLPDVFTVSDTSYLLLLVTILSCSIAISIVEKMRQPPEKGEGETADSSCEQKVCEA